MIPLNNKGHTVWSPLIILLLTGISTILFWLYVGERATGWSDPSPQVLNSRKHNETQQFKWKMVTSWPKNFPGLGTAPEYFARTISEMSDGRLHIQVYGAGELVPALSVLDSVSAGSVEMGHTAAYYHRGKIPAAAIFAAIPFGMNTLEMNAWLYHDDGLQLWRELYEPFNVIPFPGGNSGMQMAGWFNRELHTIDDLSGLKMRIPGLAGEIFNQAGGAAIALPGGEIYTSMQTGVIDATEWVGPYNDRAFGLHEVGEHYYYPGWQELSTQLEFIINAQAWQSLPKDLQAIVDTAARAANLDMINEYTARNSTALESLREDNIVPRRLSNDILKTLHDYSLAYYQELAAKDPNFARIYQSYEQFRKHSSQWMDISERVILESREIVHER